MRVVARLLAVLALVVGGFGLAVPPAGAAVGAPALSVAADGWHVSASLSGTTRFEYAVEADGKLQYYKNVTSPFVVDPLVWGGRTVRVNAHAWGVADAPWGQSVTFAVPVGKPALTVASDKWHVTASLPNAVTYVFVVKSAGMDDHYVNNTASTFLVDPWTYGGKTVTVSARAQGTVDNPWGQGVSFTVPAPVAGAPVLDPRPDKRHVYASLPGTTSFVWVVKTSGLDDYYVEGPSPYAIDPAVYGGRSVRVSARAAGPESNPWSAAVSTVVPPVKYYGIVDANGPKLTSGADSKGIGVTLDRVDFTYPESFASLDAKVARDAAAGITTLPLLSQYGKISDFDLTAWSAWAAGVVARYGPGGAFWAGRTDAHLAPVHFELLNEPYVHSFYPDPEPAAYATFFTTVATAARAANPRAKFLLAADPQPFRNEAGTYTTQSWNALFKAAPDAPAALAQADAVTAHPYNSYAEYLGWGRAVDVHSDFPTKPVWITEVGYRLGQAVDGTVLTEESQAAYLQRSLTDFVSWPWAQAFIWFKYADYSATNTANMWGVVNWDGTHRLSYAAYRQFIS